MKEINVTGQKRSETGKKASNFAVPMTELRKVVYTPHIYVVNLNIDGQHHTAIMKELQFHPVTDALMHIDFYEVNEAKPITIGVPVKLNGLAQGVRDGGRLALIVRKVNVTAMYQNIPETLDIDVTDLTIGKSIKVGDLKFEGLEMATSKEVVVCTIKATRKSNAAAQDAEAAE